MKTKQLKSRSASRLQKMPKTKPTTPRITDLNPNSAACPLSRANLPEGSFWATIPTPETFTPEERVAYEAGLYTIRISEHLPEHETFVDFLIEQGVAEWRRLAHQGPPANDVTPRETEKDAAK